MKKFWREAGLKIAPPVIYMMMRIVWFTTRKTFHFINPVNEEQHVCVCWHGELFMSPQAYRKIHKKQAASAMVSSHTDGTLLASVFDLFHIKPLRGSTKKGAAKVLIQAIRSIKEGNEVLITPDGPGGPRHSMSDGAIVLALKGNVPIFIVNFQANRFWQVNSWDKFVIPKPFAKVDFYIQEVSVERMELEEAKSYLHAKMLEHTIE